MMFFCGAQIDGTISCCGVRVVDDNPLANLETRGKNSIFPPAGSQHVAVYPEMRIRKPGRVEFGFSTALKPYEDNELHFFIPRHIAAAFLNNLVTRSFSKVDTRGETCAVMTGRQHSGKLVSVRLEELAPRCEKIYQQVPRKNVALGLSCLGVAERVKGLVRVKSVLQARC